MAGGVELEMNPTTHGAGTFEKKKKKTKILKGQRMIQKRPSKGL